MDAPQVVMIVVLALSTFAGLVAHGKVTKQNFFMNLISNALLLALLVWGGFFA